jgi:2'-hydroxyisoflavone reductase
VKVLILGGTRFVGRALVEHGLDAGHDITLFNRGKSNAALFPQVETIVGDRDGGLGALTGRKWDAVIDTCGYLPRLVRDAAEALKDSVEHYSFISSISVFSRFDQPGLHEDSPLGTLEDEIVEEVNDQTYGPLKVLCERELNRVMPGRVLHVRPGLIIGPHDESDRLTYWVNRVATGGEVLATGIPDAPMQFIDVRDLAAWIFKATEARLTGPYICTGPNEPLTTGILLETCKRVSGSDATFTWVGDAFLRERGLTEDSQIPWWVPEAYAGYAAFNTEKARRFGLTIRPLAQTVRDTLDWHATRPTDHTWRSGLNLELEQLLLTQWHTHHAGSNAQRSIMT